MLQNIQCCDPVLIKNRDFQHMMLTFACWHSPSGFHRLTAMERQHFHKRFPWERFSNDLVDKDRLEDYYFINPLTGETYSMYMEVPCGHCTLCSRSKVLDWCFRCHCESSTSTTIPLFVTLTYAKEPVSGVDKKHIQDFLKRVRIALSRMGYSVNLRYFCCAEYGKNTSRAHYHMILWNFPYMDDYSFLSDIKIRDFLADRWQHGFIKTLPVLSGCSSYVMKYMAKPGNHPFGKNPTFYLASRRSGGLGVQVCDNVTDFYRTHPEILDIKVYDPYTNSTFEYKLPQYFKSRIFPTMSKLVPVEVRRSFNELNDIYTFLCSIRNQVHEGNIDFFSVYSMPEVKTLVSFFRAKFDFLPVWSDFTDMSLNMQKSSINWNSLKTRFTTALTILSEYNPDEAFINHILDCIARRQIVLHERLRQKYDIDSLLRDFDKKIEKLIRKEIL